MVEIIVGKIVSHNKIIIGIVSLSLCMLLCGLSMAGLQEDELFEKAYEYYYSYQPDEALEYFDSFLQSYPDSFARDAAFFWKAKSLIQLERSDEAEKIFLQIRELFPESPFLSYIDKELSLLRDKTNYTATNPMTAEKKREGNESAANDREIRIKELEAEKITFEERLAEMNKLRMLTEKGLSKAIEDNNHLATLLQEAKKNNDDLLGKLSALENEKTSAVPGKEQKQHEADLNNLISERDKLIKKIDELERINGEIRASIKDREQENSLALIKFLNEKTLLEADLKEKDQRIGELSAQTAEADNQIRQIKAIEATKTAKENDEYRKQGETELVELKLERDVLQQKAEELKAKDQEIQTITARHETQEIKLQITEVKLRDLEVEKEATGRKLRQNENRLAAVEEELKQERSRSLELARKGDMAEKQVKEFSESVQAGKKLQQQLEQYHERILTLEKDIGERDRQIAAAEQSIALLNTKIQEVQKQRMLENQDNSNSLSKLLSEKTSIEMDLKEKERRITELTARADAAENQLAEIRMTEQLQRAKESGDYDEQLEKVLAELISEQDSLRNREEELAIKEREIQNLKTRVEELEKKQTASDALLKSSIAEKTAAGEKLKEHEDALAAIQDELRNERSRIPELTDKSNRAQILEKKLEESAAANRELQQQVEKYNNQLSSLAGEREICLARNQESEESRKVNAESSEKLKASYEEVKKTNVLLLEKDKSRSKEISLLRDMIIKYETPVLEIGENRFSLGQILDGYRKFSNVLQKIKAPDPIWRQGDPYSDFVIQELLMQKAIASGIREDGTAYHAMIEKYSVSDGDLQYLLRYLDLKEYVDMRLADLVADEKYVRNFYEVNKEKYVKNTEEKQVKVLSVKYTPAEELEKGILAVDFQNDVLGGKSFETVYKFNSNVLSFDAISVSDLPDFIKERISGLHDGEVSNIISYDNKFMIFQIQGKQKELRSFEDFYAEIRAKYSDDQTMQVNLLKQWLHELRKGAKLLN